MTHSLAVLAVTAVLLLPRDLPIQCDDSNYRRINPQVCGEQIFPFPEFGHTSAPTGGGGGNGGSVLGRILHGLTGGLL